MTCTVLLALVTIGSCNGLAGNDEMDRYFQRSDTLTLSAGDAKQANAVTHTINPWPSYVGDRRIVCAIVVSVFPIFHLPVFENELPDRMMFARRIIGSRIRPYPGAPISDGLRAS